MLCLYRCFTQTAKIIKCDDGLHHICSKDKVNLLNKLVNFKSALEGSYARKENYTKNNRNNTTDKDLNEFEGIIKSHAK